MAISTNVCTTKAHFQHVHITRKKRNLGSVILFFAVHGSTVVLFYFLRAYISEFARWKRFLGRDHVISAFFLYGCIIRSRCSSLHTRIKKEEEEKKSVRRGIRTISSWTENRWLQPRCALVVIGEQNFLLIIRLVPGLSFTTSLKRIFRALIAKGRHSSSSDDGPGDALLFTSLFVFYDPRCFFPHYFITRSTL